MRSTGRFLNSRVLVGHLGSVYSLSAVNGQLLSAGGDGNIVRWDPNEEKPGIAVANVESQIYCICAVGPLIVAGSMNGAVFFVDHSTRTLRKKLLHHQKGVFSILPISGKILTGGGDGMVTLWDSEQLLPKFSLQLSKSSVRCMAHIEGDYFVVGCSEGNIYSCQIDDNQIKLLQTVSTAHQSSVFSLAYHPAQQVLISGGRDAQLNFWDLDFKLVDTIAAHLFTINSIAIHPGLGLLATGSRDKTIKIWDLATHQLIQVLEAVRDRGHFNSINALIWVGDTLVSGSDDKRLICWKT